MDDIDAHRFSVAPMIDWTDRYCRFFHRQLTQHTRLYTEMIVDEAILRGNVAYLLDFDPAEHPVALQLGGSDPQRLAAAAAVGAAWGYDEINLNVGCPSDRVQSGRFGACLMQQPALVAECIAAMAEAVSVPVTVKCRIGVDDQNPEDALPTFVERVAATGCTTFIVHARKAWLNGLSPKENRTVPPLDYNLVSRLKVARPDLTIVLNGGITSLDAAAEHLSEVDGVMLGRAAYERPALLADVDRQFFGGPDRPLDRIAVIRTVAEHFDEAEVPLWRYGRHLLGLFHGCPGARIWRRVLSEEGRASHANAQWLVGVAEGISSAPASLARAQ
ncbi:MAG: tRNA dihydrouridine(20/20a) synthase DusA [Pseudomonadota bacterium]